MSYSKQYLIAHPNMSEMPVGGLFDSVKSFASKGVDIFGEIKKQEGAAQAAASQQPVIVQQSGPDWGKIALFGALGVGAVFLIAKVTKKKR